PLRRNGADAERRGPKAAPTLFRFRDFMLQGLNFLSHLAQLHVSALATWFVEEINNPPRRAAGEHDKKTHRADKHRDRFRHATKAVEHDLKNFLAQPDAGQTNRQGRDRAFDRHDGKKIEHPDVRPKGKSDEEESGKGREMSDDRRAEGSKRRAPMMRIEMIGG